MKAAVGRSTLSQKQQTRVNCRTWKHLSVAKVDDMTEMSAFGDDFADGFAILDVEKLVRANVGELTIGLEQA